IRARPGSPWTHPRRPGGGVSHSHAAGCRAAAGPDDRLRQLEVRGQLLHRVPRQQGPVRQHRRLARPPAGVDIAPAATPGARAAAVLRLGGRGPGAVLGNRGSRAGVLPGGRRGPRRVAAEELSMRWRGVVIAWVVCLALAGEYWAFE